MTNKILSINNQNIDKIMHMRSNARNWFLFQNFPGIIPTEKLTHEAYWVLNTINTRASITPDACEQSSCPLAADDVFLLRNQLFVNSTLPSVSLKFLKTIHSIF